MAVDTSRKYYYGIKLTKIVPNFPSDPVIPICSLIACGQQQGFLGVLVVSGSEKKVLFRDPDPTTTAKSAKCGQVLSGFHTKRPTKKGMIFLRSFHSFHCSS